MEMEDVARKLQWLGWTDLAQLVTLPPEECDAALAAYWRDYLRDGDLSLIVALASLWLTRRELTRTACACVRPLVRDNGPLGRMLEIVEQWTEGNASIEAVWEVGRKAMALGPNGLVVVEVANSAGDAERDDAYDANSAIDEAASAVGDAIASGVPVREVFASVPPPTHERLAAASVSWEADV